ncbi:MAG: S8 family serine peptidase [candidate division WOR-3 bacterium]
MLWVISLAKLQPELEAKLNSAPPEQKFRVFLVLKDQPDYEEFMRQYPKRNTQTLKSIFTYVKDLAKRTQEPVIEHIKSLGITNYQGFWISNEIFVEATPQQIRSLAARNDITYIYEEEVIYLFAKPSDGGDIKPDAVAWGVDKIKADSVWAYYGIDGTGVIIASMDSGVMASHPALNGKVIKWYDPYGGSSTPTDESACSYHGTHTSGTMVGGDGLGSFSNDIGVAPGARLAMVRIFGGSFCSTTTTIIRNGFQRIVDWKVDSGINIVAVNNSWGSTATTDLTFWNDVLAWRTANIIPVFSIGNSGPGSGTAGTPGNFPTVIGVGATDNSDRIASFSSRGPAPNSSPWNNTSYWPRSDWNFYKPNISAPGVNVYSSYGSSSYTNMSGTSMAAPHVTGTIALMFQKNATLDFTQVYNILLDYADRPAPDCNSIPNNNCGWGRLNALRAVENTPSSSVPYIALSRVFVDDAAGNNNNIADPGETVNLIITLRNSGGGAANNTQATIYTSNPYITIIDNSAVYGNIAPSDSATNTSDVFTISVSPSAPIGLSVRFDMYVSANSGGYNDTLNFTLTIGNPVDVFVIDTGTAALWIPVNQPGGIGTHYGDTTTAKGFKYPKTGANLLYYAGVAFGNSQTYVPDGWYDGGDISRYYGGFIRSTPMFGDENGAAGYDDSGHSTPFGVELRLEAYGYRSYRPNWVFLRYELVNRSTSPLNNVYIGVFADFDVSTYNQNYAATDTSLKLAYIYHSSYPYRAGVALVDPVSSLANLSAIDNSIYVYSGTPDTIKWKFLNGTLSFPSGSSANDWSVVASAGPFNIPSGGSQVVTFAIVGFDASTDISETFKDVIPPSLSISRKDNGVELIVNIPYKSDVSVEIFSPSGRLVKNLYKGYYYGNLRFDLSDLSKGAYMVRVKAGNRTTINRFIVK